MEMIIRNSCWSVWGFYHYYMYPKSEWRFYQHYYDGVAEWEFDDRILTCRIDGLVEYAIRFRIREDRILVLYFPVQSEYHFQNFRRYVIRDFGDEVWLFDMDTSRSESFRLAIKLVPMG